MKKIFYILKNRKSDCYQLDNYDLFATIVMSISISLICLLIISACSFLIIRPYAGLISTTCGILVLPIAFMIFSYFLLRMAEKGLNRYHTTMIDFFRDLDNAILDRDYSKELTKRLLDTINSDLKQPDENTDILRQHLLDIHAYYFNKGAADLTLIKGDFRHAVNMVTSYIHCKCYNDYARQDDIIVINSFVKDVFSQSDYNIIKYRLESLRRYV